MLPRNIDKALIERIISMRQREAMPNYEVISLAMR